MSNISTKIKSWTLGGLTLSAALVLGQLVAAQAHALEIENEDDEEYTVQITEGDNLRTITVAAKSRSENLCEEECTISIENVGEYEAAPTDVVKIRQGQLVNE